MIRVSVAGASGYSGGELVRCLLRHPSAELVTLTAGEQQGRELAQSFPSLNQLVSRRLEAPDWSKLGSDSDVVFLALPHGMAMDAAPAILDQGAKVIDLGADFRLKDAATYARFYGGDHRATALLAEAVYGLTEMARPEIAAARLIANPGCYPTAVALALLPLLPLLGGAASTVIVDAKSGVSGAGRSAAMTFFGEVNENVRPYSVGGHRHVPEMEQTLAAANGVAPRVFFAPHLIPMTRGILAACYVQVPTPPGQAELSAALHAAYDDARFVRVLDDGLPQTKATSGSNYADVAVRVDEAGGVVAVFCALDNLGKGAAGQAIQNMNVMCGLPEDTGLGAAPLFP